MSSSPTVIRNVTPNVATFSRPFSRFGLFPIGGRSTAIKLQNDQGVWLLASTPLDKETKAKLDEMGDVKYIVAGDYEHHLSLQDYTKAYPQAKLIGVDGLGEKRKDLKFDGEYGKDPKDTKYGYEEEIQAQYFPTFSNKDVVFVHKDSKTLLATDLLFNLPCNEQYSKTPKGKATTWVPFVGGLSHKLSPKEKMHQNFLWNTSTLNDAPSNEQPTKLSTDQRRKRFAQDAAHVAQNWEFDRIIPSHGDVIETGGKQAWLDAYSRFLNPDGSSKI